MKRPTERVNGCNSNFRLLSLISKICIFSLCLSSHGQCQAFVPHALLTVGMTGNTMTPTIHYSSIQKSNPRVDMTKVEECNDDERNTSMIAMSRRKALLASFAMASSAILVSPSASTAKSMDDFAYKIPSLVDINLGQGEWLHLSEQTGSSSLSTSMIQPNFATYATRFLINYDDGVAQWWKDVKYQNSLVSASEERNNLGKSFGSLTRSIQISLDHFCTGEAISTLDIQQKMEQLFKVFYESYVIQPDGTKNEEAGRQLGILFSILAVKYQPLNGMKNILYIKEKPTDKPAVPNSPQSPDKISIAFTEELTNLLPSRYQSYYDPSSKSYKIQPEVPLYEIGIENEFGQNAIATPFGPLSSVPLQRREPNLSSGLYALLGMSGALACVVTHSLVIPFDVVKTRLQTDPERYSNIIEGTMSIAENEGIQGFTLGAEATIAGYFWYGLSVYPSYTFSKWYLSHELLTPAYATAHASAIALAAGAIAAVIASIGLAPLEACRIRTVAEPEVYRDIGLKGTLQVIAEEDTTLGWKKLYAGLPSLMIRQVIFGSVKFIAFEKASENIFITWPSLRDATVTALGVTLVAGALSGALSSVVSQPADSVLTYVAKSKGDNGSLFAIVNKMVEEEGAGSLFRGLGSRCIWATAIISGQFFLYDIFRTALGINNDDLSQVFEFVVNTIN